jgi:hypothetical protein
LWQYYTGEAPPLWILPAWPVAQLAINRIVRFLRVILPKHPRKLWVVLYWIIFPVFLATMLPFVWPTIDKPLSILATLACVLITFSTTSHRTAVLTFVGAISLGYFLELWGTTHLCWTYYTEYTTTLLFTVLVHGMVAAAVYLAYALSTSTTCQAFMVTSITTASLPVNSCAAQLSRFAIRTLRTG